jgi:hypothetical protein
MSSEFKPRTGNAFCDGTEGGNPPRNSREELEALLQEAKIKLHRSQHELNNAVQGVKMIEKLLEVGYGVKPNLSEFPGPWTCTYCQQLIPSGQYHDCKGGTL